MLQYPTRRPIPFPASYKSPKDVLPEHRRNDSLNRLPVLSRLFSKRFTKDRSSHTFQQQPTLSHVNNPSPHSISTSLPTSSPTDLPLSISLLISPTPASLLTLPSPLPPSVPIPLRPSLSLRPRSLRSTNSARYSTSGSSTIDDVLAPGDSIGEGIPLQGHHIRVYPAPIHNSTDLGLAKEFEVVRKLGTGSYAIVYLVREVLSRVPPFEGTHRETLDIGELTRSKSYVTYGRDFALKCLNKASLDQCALDAQMAEVTIHQSLRPHPNIVTLYRTYETPTFLLLLLEYVPGEDLFYFLEQARDHYEPTSVASEDGLFSSSGTPSTLSLLASLHPSQLLNPTRLQLIARMFSQMCDAVASCHEQGVYHRDIKPENFIVTDEFVNGERHVVVKLTDFGLSTTETDCSDMDCGSAPYMNFECRNNCAPTYQPAPADVWSLGIVLINMLYHYNPWTDTAPGVCSSFNLFRHHGSNFFVQRFTGMTTPVAEFFATRVFYLPPSASFSLSANTATPVTAREFGAWIMDLPALMSESMLLSRPFPGHGRVVSASSNTFGHLLTSCALSRRPSSRAGGRMPVIHSCSSSWTPPGPASEKTESGPEMVPNLDNSVVAEAQGEIINPSHIEAVEPTGEASVSPEQSRDTEHDLEDGQTRSMKNQEPPGVRKSRQFTDDAVNETLEVPASASQALAREISLALRSSSRRLSGSMSSPIIDISGAANIAPPQTSTVLIESHYTTTGASVSPISPPAAPTVTKKASNWRLSLEESAPSGASDVISLIMGLSPVPAPPSPSAGHTYVQLPPAQRSPTGGVVTWTRGRQVPSCYSNTSSADRRAGIIYLRRDLEHRGLRGASSSSSCSGLDLASDTSSAKSNWRSSITSSVNASTGAFSQYSNPSVRIQPFPQNVKIMSGVPWELDELPRRIHPNPAGGIFGQPPQRKPQTRKPKDPKLDTISERPGAPQKHAVQQHRDAATSTTDLSVARKNSNTGSDDAPKKVQKGQINALAKMLAALRR